MNIGFGELLILAIIAMVVIGPKDLPRVAKLLGKLCKQGRTFMRSLYPPDDHSNAA